MGSPRRLGHPNVCQAYPALDPAIIWGVLGVVPHELDALFHGQSQSQMDDWGYPYDLGNLHIVPKALKSLDQNHTIPKTLRLDPKVFLFVVIDKVVITV